MGRPSSVPSPRPRRWWVLRATGLMLRLAWRAAKTAVFVAFYGTPLVGFWLSSSLAAYLGGPTWLAWVSGLIVFPVLPLYWEQRASRNCRTKEEDRLFTLPQRVSLRTFAVGLAFLLLLLCLFPRTAFVSLSTRGDWMLDGRTGPRVELARKSLFLLADGLEWLYRATRRNPYEAFVENQVDRVAQLMPDSEATCPRWPWKGVGPHRLVTDMPPAEEASLESVARYIARNESDPFERVKALHDYVALRITYDFEALETRRFPLQDAETVFRTRKAVCAGFSNLLAAMGKAINEQIVVVLGWTRDENGKMEGNDHAWNAVRIEGRWYLMDATWDSGQSSKEKGHEYRTVYLFPPPIAMTLSHLPAQPGWQLLSPPISQGEFLRRPMAGPAFHATGLQLVSPDRSQVEVSGPASVMLKNPRRLWIHAMAVHDGKPVSSAGPLDGGTALLECPLPSPGRYRVNLFVSETERGRYEFVAGLEFVKR